MKFRVELEDVPEEIEAKDTVDALSKIVDKVQLFEITEEDEIERARQRQEDIMLEEARERDYEKKSKLNKTGRIKNDGTCINKRNT